MAPVDPAVVLATSMESTRGAYALLLGSGFSRSAGIPTGWDVALDLAKRVAAKCGASPDDPMQWYAETYGQAPNYSVLLAELGRTPTERQQLLRSYFEPSEPEKAAGRKVPQQGHLAVAQLVARGHIKVVLTTNFDRLLEAAIQDAGVVPQVVASADSVRGMMPLTHTNCTVVKLHGDYLDMRLRNTEQELAKYPPKLQRLLNQVLDEYGLVVCGWSGEWDVALAAAIERRANRRFSTYWVLRGEPRPATMALIARLGAVVIPAPDADSFMVGLNDAVQSLGELQTPDPTQTKLLVATLKRLLPDSAAAIRVRDLIVGQTEALVAQLTIDAFPSERSPYSDDELLRRLGRYESLTRPLCDLMAVGCYWTADTSRPVWARALRRVTDTAQEGSGLTVWIGLRRYPALLVLYAAGIACLTGEKHHVLADLLLRTELREYPSAVPLGRGLSTYSVLAVDAQRRLPGMDRHHTPLSEHLADVLRESLRDLIPSDEEYTDAFDDFEYFLGLVAWDLNAQVREQSWGPVGCFAWRGSHPFGDRATKASYRLGQRAADAGDDWPVLAAGFFGGSLERYEASRAGFDDMVARLGWFF